MPLIEISMYPESANEQKEAFTKAITNAAVEILKIKPEDVIITYGEEKTGISPENRFKQDE